MSDWPTLADVHAAVLRVDGRLELLADRQEAAARELERHRAEERRTLDDHEERLRSLSRWRWTVAGGLAVVVAAVGLLAAPVLSWIV